MANLTPMRRNFDLVNERFGFFSDFFNDNFFPAFQNINRFKADIRDEGSKYVIEADLPGFHKEDIDIEYNDKYLTIKGVREEQKETDKNKYIHQERQYGEFVRKFYLQVIKEDEIKATFTDGVFELEVPKDESSQTTLRRIDIN
ncbi:Hsp20/alpha crystallin family protein [Bacillus sp. FJAT-44742]|uniref:Hsp20/alpha crystallin family protein n=1 Tax=Bacillus sp. FJAT-44742 TaxID=2014005 RepID=UPI000C2363D0|nr:Hsp20/alpha crystallin family protein [Bacillus sp. FJAT-44742]